jgi:hypothetical protein
LSPKKRRIMEDHAIVSVIRSWHHIRRAGTCPSPNRRPGVLHPFFFSCPSVRDDMPSITKEIGSHRMAPYLLDFYGDESASGRMG